MKKSLNLKVLKSINELSNDELSFLRPSTFKRNLAYHLMYLEFIEELDKNYNIYGAVKAQYIKQATIVTSSAADYLLRLVLSQEGYKIPLEKKIQLPYLLGKAKGAKTDLMLKALDSSTFW